MSKMRWVRLFVFALALFVVGPLAYKYEFSDRPQKEEQAEEEKRLFQLKDTQIASIEIADGKNVYQFKCVDIATNLCKPGDHSKWELAQHGQASAKFIADEANVNALVSAVNHLTSSETISLSEETPEKRASLLKDYELAPERRSEPAFRRITVTPAKGAPTTVYFGGAHPIGDNIFAVRGGDENKVYLTPSHFKTNFERTLTYWRNKKLMSLAAHEVENFTLESGKGRIQGARKDGQWELNGAFPGDIENTDALLTGATYLTAKEFAAKSALTGAKKAITLVLKKKDSEPVTLTVFDKAGKVYATVTDMEPVFELDPGSKARFEKTLKDLRLSKLITSMERYTIKRFEFAGKPIGDPAVILTQKDTQWIQGDREVEQGKVQNLLDRLSGNKIQGFLEGPAIPTGEGTGVRVVLSDEKGDAKRQLLFWTQGEKLYARDLSSKRKEAFVVDNILKDALPWQRDFFVKSQGNAK